MALAIHHDHGDVLGVPIRETWIVLNRDNPVADPPRPAYLGNNPLSFLTQVAAGSSDDDDARLVCRHLGR